MADLRRVGKNNLKRGIAVAVSEAIATSATMDDTIADIPVNSLITNVAVIVETASGIATDTVDVKVGATVVANEVVVGTVGVKNTEAYTQFLTGGAISVVAGADAPDAAGVIRVIVEYIELDTTSGAFVG